MTFIFTSETPSSSSNDAHSPRSLGAQFKAAVNGTISTMRYYHVGPTRAANWRLSIWDPANQVTPLTTATGTDPGANGWASLVVPTLSIVAGTIYTMSVDISLSGGGTQPDYGFTGSGAGSWDTDIVNGNIRGLASSGLAHNDNAGITPAVYPSNGASTFNFFIDVDFIETSAISQGIWGVSR